VLFYEYQPSLYHCKVLIVDDIWVSVGSTNFDNRSFRLNDEANLNIYDADFAAQQATIFESDKSASRQMTRADFKNRSLIGKMFDAVAGVLRQQF
jgi:cardiolipin synthase